MLSIIIPTLNEEKYIGNLLNSLKNQTYKDFEIIIVDAGSRDGTEEVISKADIGQIPLKFVNLDNRNVSLQRNKGASIANGELLLFIDADIVLSKEDILERLVKIFENNKIVAATTKVHVNSAENKLIDRFFHFFTNTTVSLMNKLGFGASRGACQIIRKNVFDEIKGYNTNIFVAEDTQLFSRLAKKGKIYFSKDIIAYESARRYRKEGYIKTTWQWTINGLWVFFTGKSYYKEWKDVR
jgi:glycosyltransferase involved in cell wall biosynthesis